MEQCGTPGRDKRSRNTKEEKWRKGLEETERENGQRREEESHREKIAGSKPGRQSAWEAGPAVVDSGFCPSMQMVKSMNVQELGGEEAHSATAIQPAPKTPPEPPPEVFISTAQMALVVLMSSQSNSFCSSLPCFLTQDPALYLIFPPSTFYILPFV